MSPRVDASLQVREAFERAAAIALEEDLGSADISSDETTFSTVPPDATGSAVVYAKADGVICGLDALKATYARIDPKVRVDLLADDGDDVSPGAVLARVEGSARAILVGERTALNLIGHLSGIATQVRAYVREAKGTTLVDTRKTLPGLRTLQKYAVRVGDGSNHRFGLFDGVLIKDNHIVAAGGLREAVAAARQASSLPVQVECATSEEVDEALDAGAHAILLDNMTPAELAEMTKKIKARAEHVMVEASGGVNFDNVAEVASSGVDRISIGAFTHSVIALDISMELEEVKS